MGESQSRYGIIEELNNRKINVREKLSNIERETDNFIYTTEKTINNNKQKIINKEMNYVQRHKDKQRELKLALAMMTSDFNRAKAKADEEIAENEATYKQKFEDWKAELEKEIKTEEETLARYKTVQQAKIEEKKSIIKEIEDGIKDLKEVSKESNKD